MNKTALQISALVIAAITSEAASKALGYQIEWPAVGICLTALIAIWKLREDSDQKALDRELQTKREILLAGVEAMTMVHSAFSALSNNNINLQESVKNFQIATAKITMATTVASLESARLGSAFINAIGPLFLQAMELRSELDELPGGKDDPSYFERSTRLSAFILDNVTHTAKLMLHTIASVREDIGISKESTQQFLEAVRPDEVALKRAIDKILGRALSD